MAGADQRQRRAGGMGAFLGAGFGGHDAAAHQVANVVDHQGQAVGAQVTDLVGQPGDHQLGDDRALERDPQPEQHQRRQTAPDRDVQPVVGGQRMQGALIFQLSYEWLSSEI